MTHRGLVALVVSAVLAGGCFDSGGDDAPQIPAEVAAQLARLQPCLENGSLTAVGLFQALVDLVNAAEDPEVAESLGIVITPAGVNAFDFSFTTDLDGDGASDDTLSGTITFSGSILGGIEPGLTAQIQWALADLASTLGGSGTFEVVFLEGDQAELTGSGSVQDFGSGCTTTFSILVTAPLVVDASSASATSFLIGFGVDMAGSIEFVTFSEDDQLSGRLVLSFGSQIIQVRDVEVNGTGVPGFDIDGGSF